MWTDVEAKKGKVMHSKRTDKFAESISWIRSGYEGMDVMRGAIPGAIREWYSELKNNYDFDTGKGNCKTMCHFMPVVWKSHSRIGCGLNIKPHDGTYVTAQFGPTSHGSSNDFKLVPQNVLRRKEPGTSYQSAY
jgi:hypothetical protein